LAHIVGVDHVAITVADLEATYAFYDRLFGAVVQANHQWDGKLAIRKFAIGGAMLSVHQAGNGVDLVAARPTPGSVDICFRWSDGIETAVALLQAHGIAIIDGPSPRKTAEGAPARSVYFRDPDNNLIELMAAD
jgi:catechol 2,3-dioxygenase-like lactoylglutathione lyase family enzyme